MTSKSNIHTIDYMKTATINFKTDFDTKIKAHDIATKLGIPLSSLLNAYLHKLVATGRVTFSTAEPMSKKIEAVAAQAEKDITNENTSGPFKTAEEAIEHLNKLQ